MFSEKGILNKRQLEYLAMLVEKSYHERLDAEDFNLKLGVIYRNAVAELIEFGGEYWEILSKKDENQL
ncbi:MAG: hypothetical protein Q4C70_01595 [Planctomycetia bacterium]|nr:hypothetical protein [Planctomycetia bacterium]